MSTDAALYRLLAWLSPAYPVGAYSYSHGLEWAVEAGLVRDRAGLEAWLATVLRHGGGWMDAVLLAHAHRAVTAGDDAGWRELRALAQAWTPTAELALETRAQGEAFAAASLASWPDPGGRLPALLADGPGLTYPLGGRPPSPPATPCRSALLLPAYLQAFAANLVSAAVRLVPLGPDRRPARHGRPGAHRARGRGPGPRLPARRARHRHPHRRPLLHAPRDPVHEAVPLMTPSALPTARLRVGIGGPVGSGKTMLCEVLCKAMRDRWDMAVITNDIYTKEDQRLLTVAGALPPERIMGVETGGCPHTAIREDASINLAAVREMTRRFPDLDLLLIESGGDNLAATFSPELADLTIYVIDVAGGEKIPRKGGPGITRSRPAGHQQDRPGADGRAPTSA